MIRALAAVAGCVVLAGLLPAQARTTTVTAQGERAYLTWSAREAERVGRAARAEGRVGPLVALRVSGTDRAHSYRLRATWLAPDAIRATARLAQLSRGLSDAETEALVRQAEGVDGIVILAEIDPIEGSGVIPLEWTALFGPARVEGQAPRSVRGRSVPALRDVPALAGVFRRDYAYDLFWLVFQRVTESGEPLFLDTDTEAELVVRIYDKEGRVRWPLAGR